MAAERERERENSRWIPKASGVVGLLMILSSLAVPANAETWSTLYQTDFSTDPGWITNNASRYHWDFGSGSYYTEQVNGSNEYSYHLLSDLDLSKRVRLEYDIKPVSIQYAADLRMGLTSEALSAETPVTMTVIITDGGATLRCSDLAGHTSGPNTEYGTVRGEWYHVLLEWNPSNGSVLSRETRKSDGMVIGEQEITGYGPFTGIDRIALSQVNHVFGGPLAATGYIDNLAILQTPEPATLSLLALGGLALLRRRKR
jgi:hypothetical protein